VFEDIGLQGWNEYSPEPPSDAMVTSGPFNVSEYVAGEFTELTYNPLYFHRLDRPTDGDMTTPGATPTDLTLALVAGAAGAAVVILIGGYVLMRQR